jgi:hypothetical protein
MTTILNPWLVIPVDTCAEGDFDAFAECQLSGFDQPKSEVWALYMIPDGAPLPDPWTSEGGWTGVIDNTDTTGTKGRYMAGKGSFLEVESEQVNLSEGRYQEVKGRVHELRFRVLQMHAGHIVFGKWLQRNWRGFSVYLSTVGDKLIGGSSGIKPYFVDAKFPLGEGDTTREFIDITMRFLLLQFPDRTSDPTNFEPASPNVPAVGGPVWGDGADEWWDFGGGAGADGS